MKKRFVLSGYFGFKNFGDEAILSVLVNKLKEQDHRITIISSDPKYTISKFKHVRTVYTFNLKDITNAIYKSDYLISGGGSLLQDTTSLKSLIYYLLIIFIAQILGKKVIIFAQGIGPINSKIGIFLTKLLLKRCNYVSVRDLKSFELLKSWGIESELLCDPIFSTKIQDDIEKEEKVAIQLRDFKTMNEDFIDRLAQKVSQEFSDKHIEIYSFQDAIDLEVWSKFVGCKQCFLAQYQVGKAGRGVARLRKRGIGYGGKGSRSEGLDRNFEGSKLCSFRNILFAARPEGEALPRS